MSIIKRPYEISIWQDILTDGQGGTTPTPYNVDYDQSPLPDPEDIDYASGLFLEERKIAIIGSNNMTTQDKVFEPRLNLDTKGNTTLSFSYFRQYYDNMTGELTRNTIDKYIQNERKVKLYLDDGESEDKWRDFIITSISPETENYKVAVVATDLAVMELSKIGFNKTFNSELQNNTGTISELAENALKETAWRLGENSEEIKQFQIDNLAKLKISNSLVVYLYDNDVQLGGQTITLDSSSIVYGFYTQLASKENQKERLSIVFLKDGENDGNWLTREATSKDFKDNILQNEYYGEIEISSVDNLFYTNGVYVNRDYFTTISPYIYTEILYLQKGRKLIREQLMKYDPILKRYVKEYVKSGSNIKYYGYEDAEYTVEPLVQNLITNGKDQVSLDGWLIGEETGFHQAKISLENGKFLRDDEHTRSDEYEPTSFIRIRFDRTKKNTGYDREHPNVNNEIIRCHYANSIINTGFRDNAIIINNLKNKDKFRMEATIEYYKGSSGLKNFVGMHPYIVAIPKGQDSSKLTNDVSILKSNITTDSLQNLVTIEQNPIVVNFSYIPEKYRMFKHDSKYYQIKTNSGGQTTPILKNDLSPFSESSLVPVFIDLTSMQPIFYCPYWRIHDFYYSGLITDLDSNNVHMLGLQTIGAWDGNYDAGAEDGNSSARFYLTNDGKNEFINYFSGVASKFRPLDFCILGDLDTFLIWNNGALQFIPTPSVYRLHYYVMFTGEPNNLFPRPPREALSTLNTWNTWVTSSKKFRECYYYTDFISIQQGNFLCYDIGKMAADGITFQRYNNIYKDIYYKGDDGVPSAPVPGILVQVSSGAVLASDLDKILRIRNVWKITHYEPFEAYPFDIVGAHCTFETEGTFNGKIQSASGPYILHQASLSEDNTTLEYVYDTSTLLEKDLTEQEYIVYFSNYGNHATDIKALTADGDEELYMSNILLTRYYLDKDNNIVVPETIPSTSTRTIYKYFDQNYGRSSLDDVQTSKDIIYEYQGYISNENYIPKINEKGLAYNSITTTESNIFNILQKLCEIFDCWLKINLEHDSNGRIILDEQHRQKGMVSFHKYIGNNLAYGFSKGINLNSIQRTDTSEEIVTKMIVKPNNNEFGKNNFCAIGRSKYNILGLDEIYNFDYYINKGILQNNIYEILYDYYGKNLSKIQDKILEIQEQMQQLLVQLAQIKANEDYYKTQYDATIEQITLYKNLFQTFTGYSYGYYLNNSNSGKFSDYKSQGIFQEYLEKISYYLDTKEKSYSLWNKYSAEYESKNNEYIENNKRIEILTQHKSKILQEFYNTYHAYIHEGSWISEDYLDDDKYYFAAVDVLNTSAQPRVTYNFNVVDVGVLDDFGDYNFNLGDKTYAEDTEFFGYEEDGVTPKREEVVISAIEKNLDAPEKNTITVQNYRTQFQDLFQRIAATIQAVEYHTGNYTNKKTNTP